MRKYDGLEISYFSACWIRVLFWCATFLLFSGTASVAQDVVQTPIAHEDYIFSGCKKPEAPVIKVARSQKGSYAQTATNKNIRRYNQYVVAANEYMECLSQAAERDINAHFLLVSTSLERRQREVIKSMDDLMTAVSAASASSPEDAVSRQEELLGGPEAGVD